MASSYYKDVKKLLIKNNFKKLRQEGSHQFWSNGIYKTTLATSLDDRNLANEIMKQAHIDYRFK